MKRVVPFIVAACVAGLFPAEAPAQLTIRPSYIQTDLSEGRTSSSFKVTNATDKEARYRAQAMHFAFTPEGALRPGQEGEHSLAGWIKFNPKEFTLPAGGTRLIRFTIGPPKDLEPGEYWAAIEFEPLEGTQSETVDMEGRQMNIKVVTAVLVPVFGFYGDLHFSAELEALSAAADSEQVVVSATVVNTGNARIAVSGEYEIVKADGEVVASGLAGSTTILRDSKRIFVTSYTGPLEAGSYAVRVRYTSDAFEDVLAGETELVVHEPLQARAEKDGGS